MNKDVESRASFAPPLQLSPAKPAAQLGLEEGDIIKVERSSFDSAADLSRGSRGATYSQGTSNLDTSNTIQAGSAEHVSGKFCVSHLCR